MVAILEKSDAAGGFEQIIDFLSGSYIQHALTVNPHVYISCIKQFWNIAVVKRSSDVTRLQALVNKKKIMISEEVVREILQLNDAEGVICLPNDEIFAGLARIGYEKPSTKLTFYKAYFSSQWNSKFYMYPRFIQLIIQSNIADLSKHTNRYISPVLTQKVFANMRRVGKGFSGVETPLFEAMLAVRGMDEEEEVQVPAQGEDIQENVAEQVAVDVLNTCSALVLRVKGLENANAAQQLEIVKLKARVKKLERLNKGRISVDMKTDEGIEQVVDQEKNAKVEGRQADKQAEIYNIDLDHSSKVLSMQEDDIKVQEAVEVATTTKAKVNAVQDAADATQANAVRKYYLLKMEFFKGKTYDQILPMFGEIDEQDALWRNQRSVHGLALVKRWKLLTSCGVHMIILSIV
nr:hypothetical protein [Tanacetum cinerariifolium]